MKPVRIISGIILAALLAAPGAFAAGTEKSCPTTMALAMQEFDAIRMFHARLSHLQYKYGRPDFETALGKIVKESWPKAKVIQVSASFVERAINLVDQARLRHSIALTAGLDNPHWLEFEKDMKKVTLMEGYVVTKWEKFPKLTVRLFESIKKSRPARDLNYSREEYEVVKAEAIARTSDMASYLLRWSSINRGLIDERAAVAHKQLAIVAIGMVGGSVMIGTMLASGAIVAGAGAYAGTLSANPVVSALLVKTGEAAAGAALGVVGAPAAQAVMDAHHFHGEARRQSENLQTSFSCELSKQMKNWKDRGASPYLNVAVYGGALGLAGGALTFTRASSQVVLYATGFGVGVAQLYSVGKMSHLAMESLAYYKLAQEADEAGEHEKALKLLYKSRDLSQQAHEKGLESIIIGTLSVYVVGNFRNAMKEGEAAIRTLYANSADTLPLAGKAAAGVLPKTNSVPLSDSEER